MNTLEKLKTRLCIPLDDTSQDQLLQGLLDSSEADILIETNRTELPDALQEAQIQWTIIKYNRQGIEGEQGHSEGGVNRTIYVLNEDMPASIRRYISQYRLLKVTKYAVD